MTRQPADDGQRLTEGDSSWPSIIAFTDGPLGTRTNINFRASSSGEFAQTC